MFGYRTLYFAGLTALLISDQDMGQEHAFSLPACIVGLACLGIAALLSRMGDTSILPPLYIVLSIIGYAFWWLGDLGGQQWMTVEEDSLMRWQVMFQSLGAILYLLPVSYRRLHCTSCLHRDPSMYPIPNW